LQLADGHCAIDDRGLPESSIATPPIQSAIVNPPIQSAIGNPPIQSAIGNPPIQSAIGNPPIQSAIGNRKSAIMLPPVIPLFPLPNVVLFPQVFLPLHIFEPRYRDMVADALAGDRIIGMVLLRPGWERDYEGRPPVYPIGCAGLITHAEKLQDGRYNIVLQGLEKFRIVGEEPGRTYRVAEVVTVAEPPAYDPGELRAARRKLESLLVPQPSGRGVDPKIPSSMGDEDLVNALAQYLELEPVERQALLERDDLLSRCRSLIELLEMKVIASQHNWGSKGSN
jgi:uncharacterized protein